MFTQSFDRSAPMDLQSFSGVNFAPGQPYPPMPRAQLRPTDQAMEPVDGMIERFMQQDTMYPSLVDKMRITSEDVTMSGLFGTEDYPCLTDHRVNQLNIVNKIPFPAAILGQVGTIPERTPMGLFPEINRAWLTLDSNMYLWNFETGGDVVFYDGLAEVICSVGLVKPKPGVFQKEVIYLLVATTPSEVVALGVFFSKTGSGAEKIELVPDIIYRVATTEVTKVVRGTAKGRIFLGGRDGSLCEFVYQKEIGWWGKRCNLINHSKSPLSFFVPAFVTGVFSHGRAIDDIVVDNSRNILYTLSCDGTIEAFDLGRDGMSGPSSVSYMSHNQLLKSNRLLDRSRAFNPAPHCELPVVTRIIALIPLEELDSPHLGVVGVTKEGVRFYFTTGSPPPHRPSTFRLLHIRFPPRGAQPGLGRPAGNSLSLDLGQSLAPSFGDDEVTSVIHKSGSFLMTTQSPSTLRYKIWCFSPDYFPLKPGFMEDAQFHLTTAPVSTIGEVNTNSKIPETATTGHILVHQQNMNPNRFVILSTQGTEIYEKLRPVDILAEIIRERGGPEGEEVKQYFREQGPDQACAMAVILASSYLTTQAELAEWATRAFFLYGSDPREILPMTLPQFNIPQSFRPNQMSTPQSPKTAAQTVLSPGMTTSPIPLDAHVQQMSAKHNGLYFYLVRLLRPVWTEKVVSPVKFDGCKTYYKSSFGEADLSRITVRLCALKAFLDKNTPHECTQPGTTREHPDKTPVTSSPGPLLRMQEKYSLDALRAFVEHATQVFGLWRVLSQHQLHFIIESLPPEQQGQLIASTYRDLVLCGKDLCSSLINKLINSYLNDNASVDSISMQLRKVCPLLYKSEDATCSKVNEILLSVKDVRDDEQKMLLLKKAIKLSKEVLPHMNHSPVCKQLVSHGYYEGVIELCHDAANKADLSNLSSSFLAKNQRPEDQIGSKAYLSRRNAYKDLAVMLDDLYINCQLGNTTIALDGSSPYRKILEEVIVRCLALEDEVAHHVVYDWLVTRNLQSSLIKFGRPSLERYLHHCPHDQALGDLLWQYHERVGQHDKAAHILYKLATSRGDGIKLQQRISYLGKAVMCMRSEVVGCAPNFGALLHEMEDSVQVSKIQKHILDKVSSLGTAEAEEAVKNLNSNLLSLTELYQDYATRFKLWECQLAILNCAGHDDTELIQRIWDEIITNEQRNLENSTNRNEEKMKILLSKIKSLGLLFPPPSPCFPLYYLVTKLEEINRNWCTSKNQVHTSLVEIGVKVSSVLDIYERIFSDHCNDEIFTIHLIEVITNFVESFIENPRIVPSNERRSIVIRMQDLITHCLNILYGKPEHVLLTQCLKAIQHKLNSI